MEAIEYWAIETWRQKMDGGYWERDEEHWSSQYQAVNLGGPLQENMRIVRVIEVTSVEITT
jgi:hypothetical protein